MALFLIGWFAACVVLTLLVLIAMANSGFDRSTGGVGLALGCVAFVGGAAWRGKSVTEYNSRAWPKVYARWERSYLCMQCGRVNIL
jgi:hypothetical protein